MAKPRLHIFLLKDEADRIVRIIYAKKKGDEWYIISTTLPEGGKHEESPYPR